MFIFKLGDRRVRYLIKVRWLLRSPKRWTKRSDARRANGDPVSNNHSEAVQWCLLGAIGKVVPPLDERLVVERLVSNVLPCSSITAYNDTPRTTHRDIIKLIDKAIKEA